MLVKKFEARTIKDAIQLVKREMGPDAIILSAKENANGFGLMGETSIEVTAAVSEGQMKSKNFTERKLDSKSREKFQSITAKRQKEVIGKVVHNEMHKTQFTEDESSGVTLPAKPAVPQPQKNRAITAQRYVDIDDADQPQFSNPAPVAYARPNTLSAPQHVNVDGHNVSASENQRVLSLQKEVQYLKSLLDNFRNVPQNFISMHPGAEEGLPYELSFAFQKLTQAGISHANTTEILKLANEVLPADQKRKKAFIDGWVIKYLLDHVEVVPNPMQGKVHVFVGAAGQGKTSTVVKLACHLMMKEKKKVALLTGDTVKVGATDQFKIYAQILNMPSAVIQTASQWADVFAKLQNFDYVLLDTPGLTLKNPNDLERLRRVLPPNMQGIRTHYVQSALSRDQDAFELAERFKAIGFDDVIFTRLDEAVQHGIIYNFQKHFGTPLHSFGIGPAMPEDFEFASKERVADLIFNLSKFRK